MELILKSDNSSKMAKVLALANKLGINIVQKDDSDQNVMSVPPIGKIVPVSELFKDNETDSTGKVIKTSRAGCND